MKLRLFSSSAAPATPVTSSASCAGVTCGLPNKARTRGSATTSAARMQARRRFRQLVALAREREDGLRVRSCGGDAFCHDLELRGQLIQQLAVRLLRRSLSRARASRRRRRGLPPGHAAARARDCSRASICDWAAARAFSPSRLAALRASSMIWLARVCACDSIARARVRASLITSSARLLASERSF